MRLRAILVFCCMLALVGGASAQAPPADNCRVCHSQFDGPLGDPTKKFQDDVHGQRGLTCASCHGGDARTEDMEKAKSRAAGFIGKPKRADIPRLCSRCHSDGAFMRAYNPSLRTDQFAQYVTSVHGKRLSSGDSRVAVCSDCHGIHNITPASSPVSSVHPSKIPETCGRCHADAEYMKSYKIPTDQLQKYRVSVHFETLKAGDTAAPTCATCHGNHGAAPPGVASVERVCGTCHLFQEQLFDQSPHKKPWEQQGISACLTCHGNHEIKRTSDALIGTGENSLCVSCHASGDKAFQVAGEIHQALRSLDASIARSKEILDRAERAGMEISDARLVLASAHEQLIKARVDVHASDAKRVQAATQAGSKQASEAFAAGEQALAEYAFRRKGLALSLVVIAFVVLALWFLIREIEKPRPTNTSPGESK